jgi:hypothetical protein
MGEHQILAAKLKREIDGVGPSLTASERGRGNIKDDFDRER